MATFTPSSWKLIKPGTVAIESESVPGKFYYVGIKSLKCSCPHATQGHVCKHARWVLENKKLIFAKSEGGLFYFREEGKEEENEV
jgi:hypothetical protein